MKNQLLRGNLKNWLEILCQQVQIIKLPIHIHMINELTIIKKIISLWEKTNWLKTLYQDKKLVITIEQDIIDPLQIRKKYKLLCSLINNHDIVWIYLHIKQ